MSNNILNEELSQMKYLFGYKPGKVISEQTQPTGDTKQETTFFTKDGKTFKFPGIKDDNTLNKFVANPKLEDLATQMGISPNWITIYRTGLQQNKGNRDWIQSQSVNNLWNGVNNFLWSAAEQGITPEKLSEPGIKSWIKSQPEWKYFSFITTPGTDKFMMSEDELFKKLGDFIKIKMNEIKS